MAQNSEGLEAQADMIEAINQFGSDVTITREAYRDKRGAFHQKRVQTFKCMPDLLKRDTFPMVMQAIGVTNQSVLDNHDVFYFLPDADIQEQTDVMYFDGFNRPLALVKTYPIANVPVVKIAFAVRDNRY